MKDRKQDEDRRNEEGIVEMVTLNSIMAIANAIDAKDACACGHSVRVARGAEQIARHLGWNENQIRNLYYIALLHDIGKIGVPDSILNKPAALSEEEFGMVQKHVVIGNEILKDIPLIEHAEESALYHHERYDGTGYPCGLKGEDIPLCARIIGIADAYEAMNSNRAYRARLTQEEIIQELIRGKGKQFDPELTDLVVEMIRDGFNLDEETKDAKRAGSAAEESGRLLSRILNEYTAGVKQVSMTDPLTGLHNRGFGEGRVGQLLMTGHTGAMLVIDLDNFKDINDMYGHVAGDNTLCLVARLLEETTDEADIVCRIGGDEFMVFFTDMAERELISRKTKKIVDRLAEGMDQIGYGNISTVSIGIAIHPFDGKEYATLYNNADKSLYYVKRNGKNAFYFYSDESPEGKMRETCRDLSNIRYVIEGKMKPEQGTFQVNYAEFNNLYSYIARRAKRNRQEVQLMLFTLLTTSETRYTDLIPEKAMSALKMAVMNSLRMTDVGTRYSNVQYLVILTDTDLANGAGIAMRVIDKFYRIYTDGGVSISYDIQTVHPKAEIIDFARKMPS